MEEQNSSSAEIGIDNADQPFEIHWDNHGIAHVYAATVADAYRGMGYATGSERLWQIHLGTLFATGNLASVMGSRFVSQDLMLKSFRVPAYDVPDSPGDWIVDAYLDGLNTVVRTLTTVPPEFSKAGVQPREFTRHDVASKHRFTGWFQHKTWMEKIYLGKLMAAHGTEWFQSHVRRFSIDDAQCIHDLKQPLLDLDPRIGKLLFPDASIESGSNNWAIRGSLAASGAPMLATDPHQPHTIPNVFFFVHLHAPDWDAFGASLPGTPYFMMGFNRDLAWGLTTGFVDTYDVYVERDSSFAKDIIQIDVAGEASRTFEVACSPHGPILESLTDGLGITESRPREFWTSLSWVMRDIPTSAGTLARLPLAADSEEFGEALFEDDICPLVNNIICIDHQDDLRRFIAATIPKRKQVTGTVPLPGWEPEFEFEHSRTGELLVERNPDSGFALTANNDTMGDRGDYPIHNFPTSNARADRITELLLEKQGGFTSTDFERMQLDLLDTKAREWLPDIIECLVDDDPAVERARKLLADWDYVASMDSKAACIYYLLLDRRWHIAFMQEVLGDELLQSMPIVAPAINRFSVADFLAPGSPWRAHRKLLERILCQNTVEV
ncbi:MAG: penicillin acylase family protein, partial [Pseudomonadales bacterium]